MNMKGGVGKTTLAVELSYNLAYEYDKDVLLIDFDPQANASFTFLPSSRYFKLIDEGKTILKCLLPDSSPSNPYSIVGAEEPEPINIASRTVKTHNWFYRGYPDRKAGSVNLLPAELDLMRIALNVLPKRADRYLMSRWNKLIKSAREKFDCIVVDCHPAGSFFTKSALLVSDAVVIPVTSEAHAITGLAMMREHLQMWSSSGGTSQFVVVFNEIHDQWDSEIEDRIRVDPKYRERCIPTRMRHSQLFRNQAARHATVAEQKVAHKQAASENIVAVTQEIVDALKRLGALEESWGK